MRHFLSPLAMFGVGALLASCGHDDLPADLRSPPPGADDATPDAAVGASSGESDVQSGLPCDVEAFLGDYCTSCHDGTGKKAPMALRTRADLLADLPDRPSTRAGDEAVARVHADTRPMPPGELLSEDVVAPLARWVSAGMPDSTCDDVRVEALPFEPVSPASALAKIKMLLTREAPSAEELAQVVADPAALRGLVSGFLEGDQFEAVMVSFFTTAFQQAELIPGSLTDQLNVKRLFGDPSLVARLVDNITQSFALTALDIVREGRPFTEVITTQRFQLTTALASFLLLLDDRHLDDALKLTQKAPPFDVRTEGAPIPYAESIDPGGANYLHFTAIGATNGCASTTRSSKQDVELFSLLLGYTPRAPGCLPSAGSPLFADADFDDFHAVEVSTVGPNAEKPRFFALPELRGLTALPLTIPRVGFFTTPAFFANWASNDANQMRVTTNQTLIVALGRSFDGSDTTVPMFEDGVSPDHAGPGTACYACHQTLDPMRMYFRQSLTFSYHDQRDQSVEDQRASFAFDGVSVTGKGVPGLAGALAAHPRFAAAWTQRLCYYANSSACAEDDPEFVRVAQAFAESGFDFKALVTELFSSPLVSHLAETRQQPVVSIARRDHFCGALSTRLGLVDACGLATRQPSRLQKAAEVVASSLPYDAYSRGSEVPVTLSDTSLFFRGATENLCATMAAQVVDVDAQSMFRYAALEQSLAQMVAVLMALPEGDERAAPALSILREHVSDAIASGGSRVQALRSAFVVACTSPSSVAIGL